MDRISNSPGVTKKEDVIINKSTASFIVFGFLINYIQRVSIVDSNRSHKHIFYAKNKLNVGY